ncbi:MAG: hypothetical protein HQM02_12705, partial [Magnetococcales bacterium]|nr:hypothetical protein [Magnetococcales bacterium]
MDKRRIVFAVMAGWACAQPENGAAFEVGEIAVLSPPAQKFQAEIPLRLGDGEEIKTVRLGRPVDYKVLGLNRSPALEALDVSTRFTDKGALILVTSSTPLPSRTFDLLLQVSSNKHTNFPVFRVKNDPPPVSPGEPVKAEAGDGRKRVELPRDPSPEGVNRTDSPKPPETTEGHTPSAPPPPVV